MSPDESEALFAQAAKLERNGDRDGALAIYDDLARMLEGQENHEYAINCAAQLRSYQRLSDDTTGKDLPANFANKRLLYVNLSKDLEPLPDICVKCGSQSGIESTDVKVKQPSGALRFAKFTGKLTVPACGSCCSTLKKKRLAILAAIVFPIFLVVAAIALPLPVPPQFISFAVIGALPILIVAFFFALRGFDMLKTNLKHTYVVVKGVNTTMLAELPQHDISV